MKIKGVWYFPETNQLYVVHHFGYYMLIVSKNFTTVCSYGEAVNWLCGYPGAVLIGDYD